MSKNSMVEVAEGILYLFKLIITFVRNKFK
jgi:hypothetical protein